MAAMIWAIGFTALGAVLCAAAVLAFLGIAQVRLSGAAAIERDGLATGTRAPSWSLADSAGAVHTSPPELPLQLVIFADHSLKSFPSVAEGLRELVAEDAGLEIVLLLRQPSPMAEAVLAELGLSAVNVVVGSRALYAGYNVRVGPFLIFVDSAGQVRASSLVNYSWQVSKLRQLAGLPVAAARR
ncbi:MAG TPA: hypothetical protein VME44_04750 [Streptosporangiaceae bacterium]|nr:hypothetical protein [Streptosporangiaceae bacterium]